MLHIVHRIISCAVL